jgi:geranylgeranyl diphosphate synthase type II
MAERGGWTPHSVRPRPGAPASRADSAARAVWRDSGSASLRSLIDERLQALAPDEGIAPRRVNGAIRYSLLAPGKRVRPLLAMLTASHFDESPIAALDAGCAIEMVHTASLILDDLPAMDNATLRRGQPATHCQFGEDIAILAAIALINRGFELLAATPGRDAELRLALVRRLSNALGTAGLSGGQEEDLHERANFVDSQRLENLNYRKTGVLFVVAVEAGALIANAHAREREHLRAFATHVGHAFQTLDDLLDATACPLTAGKDVGQDEGRPTIVSLLGNDGARRVASRHLEAALAALDACARRHGPLHDFITTHFAAAL